MTTIHVAQGSWELDPDDAEGVLDRLEAAARDGAVLRLRVLGPAGEQGELLVAPATCPVVVLGGPPDPSDIGLPQH